MTVPSAQPPNEPPRNSAAAVPPAPAGSNSYVYMIPLTFSCVILTVIPLVGELLLALTGGRPGALDFSALRPLALLTGAGYVFVLLLRGLLPDFQLLTLVSLLVSLATALMDSLVAQAPMLAGGQNLIHSLSSMSTFVQATFFAAAAVAGWMIPPDDPAHPPPPRFLIWTLSVLAAVHFLLPLDMVLQSVLPMWNPLQQAAMHNRIRLGLWCLVAVAAVVSALPYLRHDDSTS